MTTFSHGCPTCMASLSYKSLVGLGVSPLLTTLIIIGSHLFALFNSTTSHKLTRHRRDRIHS